MTDDYVDRFLEYGKVVEGLWRWKVHNDTGMLPIQSVGSNTHCRSALKIRDEFADYFIIKGQVPWQ